MQRFALLSNNTKDIPHFTTEAAKVRAAFNKRFYNKSSAQYSNNTVTANILPLAFGMIATADSAKVFQNISNKILVENNGHISTGVIGTQWLMRWLTKYGRADIAYKLASNKTYPSWGYMAENGATTIWELWNGNTANPAMNSQNHVMLLGDLLIWMYENLGGIQSDPTEVGYKKIIMKPSFVKDLDYVNASYVSPYGTVSSNWKKDKGELKWDLQIPGNTTALVYVPVASESEVKEGGKPIQKREGVKFLRLENGNAVFEIGSGNYRLSVDQKLASSH
jgi:alpha-L-rhamnosidase